MSTTTYAPNGLPLGGATVNGTQITVDDYINPPSRIPEIVRLLTAENQGYFAEDVFSTPGFTVQGGAVIYTPTFPQDLFLDPQQSIAPRAPGGEAPLIAGKRYEPQVARPESRAGRIVVTDEAKRWNQVWDVQNSFTKAANSFADYIQTRAVAVLYNAVSSWSRSGTGINWRQDYSSGLVNADPSQLPGADFDAVMTQFIADKAGVMPDTLILHQNDARYLRLAYSGPFMSLKELLQDYGLTLRVSPHATEGTAVFLKSKQIGVIAFDKPLDQEYIRDTTHKSDVFVLEMAPVFIAQDASAVWAVTGINV